MAEGRFLAKTIAHDLELNAVSLRADYLFTRCIPHLDREGRMVGHPTQVKGIAVPLRKEFTPTSIERALGELRDAGLVCWYEVDKRQYLEFPGFTGNQKGLRRDREAASKIPCSGVGPDCSGVSPEDSGLDPPKLSKVKSSKTKRVSPELEKLWAIHGRGSKKQAGEHLAKALKDTAFPLIQEKLSGYVRTFRDDFQGQHLWRWLRDRRWEEQNGKPQARHMTAAEVEAWDAE